MEELAREPAVRANRPATEPVSLIVCSRNRPTLLRRAVESILSGDTVPDEIVIVDQSDSLEPSVAALSRDPRAHVVHHWTRAIGLSRSINTGVALSSHDILIFTDDDIVVSATWCRRLVQGLLREGGDTIVTGRIVAGEPTSPDAFAPSLKTAEAPESYRGRVDNDVFFRPMACRRGVITAVGHFDERLGPGTRFPAAEDNDYGFRLLEGGYRVAYLPEALTYHVPWRRRDEFLALRLAYGRGQGAYYAKYFSLRDPWSLRRFGRDLIRHSYYSLLDILHGHLPTTNVTYMAGILAGASGWILADWRSRLRGPSSA